MTEQNVNKSDLSNDWTVTGATDISVQSSQGTSKYSNAENEDYAQYIKTDYTREKIENLRVSSDEEGTTPDERKKRVKKLAGAIAHSLRTSGDINVRAFGSSAISKAAKALAIAKDYLRATHKDLQLSFSPAFIETEIEGQHLTGIAFCTFTSGYVSERNLDDVKSKLFVKADQKGITAEERKNNVRKLAGAITHAIDENKECVVRCFGSAAIGKAAKAMAIARGFTATKGPDLYCYATFIVAEMNGNERTGISFYCFCNS